MPPALPGSVLDSASRGQAVRPLVQQRPQHRPPAGQASPAEKQLVHRFLAADPPLRCKMPHRDPLPRPGGAIPDRDDDLRHLRVPILDRRPGRLDGGAGCRSTGQGRWGRLGRWPTRPAFDVAGSRGQLRPGVDPLEAARELVALMDSLQVQ